MSLYETADGILGTHLTWQDLESAIQTVYGGDAEFGVNRSVSNIGDMKGFLSKIALVDSDSPSIPRIVVKIASALSLSALTQLPGSPHLDAEKMKETGKVVTEFHNREVLVYKVIQRETPECPVIKVLAMENFEKNPLKAYIISDYLADLEDFGMHSNLSLVGGSFPFFLGVHNPIEELWPVVDGLAAFSAMGQRMSEEEKSGLIAGTYLEDLIKNFYSETTSTEELRVGFKNVLGEPYTEKIESALKIFDMILKNQTVQENFSKIPEIIGHDPVLQHSDIWPSNMLFSRHPTSGKLVLRAVIDFQTASLTSPALDVACLLTTCLSSKDRRTHKDQVLDRYYLKFQSCLNDLPIPFTREQLQSSYDLCLLPAAFLALPFILSMSTKNGEVVTPEAVDKMIGLIEDLITVHEENQQKYPTFYE